MLHGQAAATTSSKLREVKLPAQSVHRDKTLIYTTTCDYSHKSFQNGAWKKKKKKRILFKIHYICKKLFSFLSLLKISSCVFLLYITLLQADAASSEALVVNFLCNPFLQFSSK